VVAKLTAVNGPLRKTEFAVDAELSIGSDPGNSMRLEDASVSPLHCRIELSNGVAILTDLDSQSGTSVNGIPVKQRALAHGDEIAVGSSLFLFDSKDVQSQMGQGAVNAAVYLSEQAGLPLEVLEFRPEELLSLKPQSLGALSLPLRRARNLSALLQICKAIGSLRDEQSLPWQLLGVIFDVIPAQRGAILLVDENTHEVRSQAAWDREHGPEHPVAVSREIVRRVIEEQVSLFGAAASAQTSISGTLSGTPHRTVLSVPMLSNENSIGLIYLESDDAAAALTRDDFPLLTAVAALAVVGIQNARVVETLGNENQRLRAEVSLTHDMVGRSPRMREVYQFIERVAPSDSTILIHGESGTGKELAARAIHKNSPRKSQPFVALNCAALTETLLESELFGHEKGAFTSAIAQKKGYLEVADGGTIFLDEIGELPAVLQAKLLRVLQEREFVRVGGTRPIKFNVRFLAATNKDLRKAVSEEKFRADLFHRLNVISITLPSLREHPEDIPSLAQHFVARHAKNCNRMVLGISEDGLACLTQYDWPGNVRELENAMERAVVVGASDRIMPEDLPDAVVESAKGGTSAPAKYHDAIRDLKKDLILSSMEQGGGSVTEAAKLLGVHANYLHRLMRNLELRPLMKKTGA
jgi:transcriptional regulator with GAF, ATPase, and Fis domain